MPDIEAELRMLRDANRELQERVALLEAGARAQKDADAALRESETRYHMLFDLMDEGVAINEAVLDEQGDLVDYVVLEVNPAFEKQTIYTAADALGRRATDLYQMTPAFLHDWWRRVAALSQTAHSELYHEPSARWFAITTTRIRGTRFASMFRNITERKREEEALRESRDRFEAVLASLGDAVLLVDPDTRLISDCNDATVQIFGYTREELVGKETAFLHVDQAHFLRFGQAAQAAYEHPGHYVAEFEMRRSDASVFPTEHFVRPIRDTEGRIRHVVSVVRDITARKQAEDALLQSRQEYRDLFENAPVGMFRSKVDGSAMLAVNQSLCHLLGYSREEMLSVSAVVHWVDARERDEYVALLRSHGVVTNFPANLVTRTGEIRHCLSSTRLYPLEGYLEGTTIDITARVHAETARCQAEAALVAERNLLRTVVDNLPDAVYAKDLQGRKTLANRVECGRVGAASEDQVLGKTNAELFPAEMAARLDAEDQMVMHGGQSLLNHEEEDQDASGTRRRVSTSKVPLRDAAGQVVGLVGISRDITDQSRLQEQLQQALKMESVGRLAGGVAHDFNNMLGVILGHAEMSMQQVDPDQPLYADLQEIQKAAQHSADLTRQLLAFARRQTVAPKVLDLNATVGNTLKMLRRLIGEDIGLVWQPGADLWVIKMDPAQVDQILANLCVNARDAIAGIGQVSLLTRNVTLGEAALAGLRTARSGGAAQAGAVPGDYVLLAVSDNGGGMDEEVLEHLFEPFYTTKGVGQGTGLGLATVYGAVQQNRGHIHVHSVVGEGATFAIYLPRHIVPMAESPREGAAAGAAPRGVETVLLVEDEPAILTMGRRMLEASGYHVLTAGGPTEALSLAARFPDAIDLVITDVVMPEMNGRDLAQRLLALYPKLKQLFMSGYTADVIASHGVLDQGVSFIQKPFSVRDLMTKVREALGRP